MEDAKKNSNYEAGLWGGQGGSGWDDGVYDGVREINIRYGDCIDSICVEYDKNGKPVKGEKHGGPGGSKAAQVKLEYPDEFLVGISGHYSSGAGLVRIMSLTFKTNKRSFGPYGTDEGTPFSFRIKDGRVVGFKGRSGLYMDAIGLHVARFPEPKRVPMCEKIFRTLTCQPKEAY